MPKVAEKVADLYFFKLIYKIEENLNTKGFSCVQKVQSALIDDKLG